jgi:hypothetical protein
MPLSATVLAGLIEAAITTRQAQTPNTPLTLTEFSQAVAEAVVTHIQTSAVVTVPGVQNGAGVGTGTVL